MSDIICNGCKKEVAHFYAWACKYCGTKFCHKCWETHRCEQRQRVIDIKKVLLWEGVERAKKAWLATKDISDPDIATRMIITAYLIDEEAPEPCQ